MKVGGQRDGDARPAREWDFRLRALLNLMLWYERWVERT